MQSLVDTQLGHAGRGNDSDTDVDEDVLHSLIPAQTTKYGPQLSRWRWVLSVTLVMAAVAATLLSVLPSPPTRLTTTAVHNTALFAACSAAGDNCNISKCCANAGMQCYEKNKYWASCKTKCIQGVDPTDPNPLPWNCKLLSGAAATPALPPVAAAATPALPPVAVLPAAGACSWEGEDCRQSRCCRRQGFQCFQKNQEFAGCKTKCVANAVDPADGDGLPWGCTVLGGSQEPAFTPKAPPGQAAGTSLFCFVVAMPDGPERALVTFLQQKGLSAFSCDASAIFQGMPVQKSFWKSVANTDIFIKIWEQVQQNGQYLSHDFTVKVDPDAVFFPDRLKLHLASLSPPANVALYLKNINFKFQFMGALEVLSKKAVQEYLAHATECSSHLGHDGGEDFYMMTCLDALGIGHMADYTLLHDKYADADQLSKKLIIEDIGSCRNDAVVAFHCYKAEQIWMGCHDVAMGALSLSTVVNCAQRTNEQPVCQQ